MPRPKKPGAPEPKKRSRNGCWPCKTRKVKCDETRPRCVNCQRQGETCDYSIRLNWQGRGKKKAERSDSPGLISFSADTTSAVPSRPSTGDSTSTQTAGQMHFQIATFGSHPQARNEEVLPIPGLDAASTNESPSQYIPDPQTARPAPSDMSMIDPELMGSTRFPAPMYPDGLPRPTYRDRLYDGMHGPAEPQYTQSYERHRPFTPNTPVPAQPPAVSRLRAPELDESIPSPGESGMQSPGASTFFSRSTAMHNVDSPTSTPPLNGNGKDEAMSAELGGFQRPMKRVRYHTGQSYVNSPSYDPTMPPPNMISYNSFIADPQGPDAGLARPPSPVETPLTPASCHSDDGYKAYPSKLSPQTPLESPDLRRLSVSSLLSGAPGKPNQHNHTYTAESNSEVQDWSHELRDVYQDTITWGIDRGFKDLDIGKNDDMNAISGSSPVAIRDDLDLAADEDGELMPIEFGFGMETNDTAFDNGGYYDKPVAICIPRALEPLPNKLLENPMNLLYFHHFLNHTAGCLVPHNCSSNPFKMILPQMAVQDDNLLNLLLAYSASHRARLLRQPEPATRIALWVQDIFPNLRHALDNPSEIISNANLATAIMLASLEIISPKAFGVAVSWQKHLDTARQMIAARGGPQRMETVSRGDKVSSFLWSWFAYLDILGSLSGARANSTSSTWIWDYEIDEENDYQIDCILGFTSRCVRILAKIAELSRVCDGQRIGPDHTILDEWHPSDEIKARAEKLETELGASREHPAKPCTHMQSTGEAAYQWDSLEMAATNEAFHLAGLVHLHRRIFGKPSTHSDVQYAVREIFGALYKVRKGSSAEACLLFPMFTAGCETQDDKQRADILERIKSIERFGMTQIHKARTLLERVWETGNPWETLVAGEFFG